MHWPQLLIDQLVRSGVDTFCISPGSRSTPLALAIAHHEGAKSFIHFDERSMAFHALGRAQSSGKPIAIVCTSGGAVANLFPAVMEASESRIPLILLTADRPPELRHRGANQTADQVKIFGSYVRFFVDLPCSEKNLCGAYLCSTLAYAVQMAQTGPVHINCMFREPFFAEEERLVSTTTHYTKSVPILSHPEQLAALFTGKKRGVIVVGCAQGLQLTPIVELSRRLGFPILADITSGLRSSASEELVHYYEAILDKSPPETPDVVLHLGDRLVSKKLAKWLKSPLYCLVASHSGFHDPEASVTHRITHSPSAFCQEILPFCPKQDGWRDQWQSQSLRYKARIEASLAQEMKLNEIEVARSLCHVPKEWGIFIANSMPIRDADAYLFPQEPIGPIFTSRGLSGIDGNIATAIGVAQGAARPIVALIGDLAALHDLNSLAQLATVNYPLLLIIINNGGGGIFSFLPIGKEAATETFFAAAHNFNFRHAAALFNLPYYTPESREALQHAILQGESCLIEVTTNRAENLLLHRKLL